MVCSILVANVPEEPYTPVLSAGGLGGVWWSNNKAALDSVSLPFISPAENIILFKL